MTEINYNEHRHDEEKLKQFNFNHIVDGIYIGNNMCCIGALQERLEKEGVRIVISLDNEQIDSPFGVESFIWLPVTDGLTPDEYWLGQAAEWLDNFVTAGKKVFVHCQKGHGRSASIVMVYLLKQGCDFDQAFETIKHARDDVHLNDTQVASLKQFANSITL